jgi:hypothetical protein
MNKIGLIFTVGTRDVLPPDSFTYEALAKYLDRDVADNGFPVNHKTQKHEFRPRPSGKMVIEHQEKLEPRWPLKTFKTPIFDSIIKFLQAHNNYPPITDIILVATDQPDSVGEHYYNNDTLFFSEIIKKKFESKNNDFKFFCNNIKIEKIGNEVSSIDAMYKKFSSIEKNKIFKSILDHDIIFLVNQGGIDAINTSVLLKSISLFGDRLRHLTVDERDSMASETKFATTFLFEKDYTALQKLLDNYLYAAVPNLCFGKTVRELAAYAEHRLHFDFDEASKAVQRIPDRTTPRREYNQQLESAKENQLKELILNAYIKFHQRMYVDALLRLFRIGEELLRTGLEKVSGIPYEDHKFHTLYVEGWIAQNSELSNHLDTYKVSNGQPLDYKNKENGNHTIYRAILEYFANVKHETIHELDAYLLKSDSSGTDSDDKKVKGLEELSSLRNKSIAAHNFEPVSLEKIADRLGLKSQDNLYEELKSKIFMPLFKYAGLDIHQNPFDHVNHAILEAARKEIQSINS